MVREKVDLAFVKEEVQKEHMVSGKRKTHKDLSQKEIDMFREIFPMTPNEDLAAQFLISENEVQTLAYTLKVYKDPAFTSYKKSKGSLAKTTQKADGSPGEPGFLLQACTQVIPEEEKRQVLNMYKEGIDYLTILDEIIIAQMIRVRNGVKLEHENQGSWRSVNDSVDTLHKMLQTAHEMKNGKQIDHNISFDDMILRSLEKK